jgi:catechol 2,3-dioxygenase-like lactoylglutathione lyase family enzyme
MIKNIRHTGIVVSDVDKSLEFYCDLLGFVVKKDLHEHGNYLDLFLGMESVKVRTIKLALDERVAIELLNFSDPYKQKGVGLGLNNIGCTHVAMTVSDLEGLHNHLTAKGVEFNNAPSLSEDGKVKVAFCRDPDGTYLELVEELS